MQYEVDEHPLFSLGTVGRQAEFHQSNADARFIIGGNRSGKTVAGAREAVWCALNLHPNAMRQFPEPNIGWVITLDRPFAEQVLLPELLRFTPPGYLKKVHRGDLLVVEMTNGSKAICRTYAQGWEKFQGAKIHWAWFDEECPEAIYDEVQVRLIDYQGPHWVTMTPVQGKTWVYTRIVAPQHVVDKRELEIFTWATTDNATLDQGRVSKVFAHMSSTVRNARMRGDFVDMEGLVWPHFDERIHVVPPVPIQPNWPIVVGIDYGYRHPFAVVFMAIDEQGQVKVFRAYRRAEALLSVHAKAILEILTEDAPHCVDKEIVDRVFRALAEGRVPAERPFVRARFYIDPSGQQVKRELLPFGISCSDARRDIYARIERVGELLLDRSEERPGIVFYQGRTVPLIDEMRGYSWKRTDRRSEDKPRPAQPQTIHDDTVDALGYAILEVPSKAVPTAPELPFMSPAWIRASRNQAARIAARMGNEYVHPGIIRRDRMTARIGRAW